MQLDDMTLIIETLIRRGLTIPTLGDRREITLGEDEEGLFCRTEGGSRISFTLDHIRATCERYLALKAQGQTNSQGTPLHRAAGQYNQPNWPTCPNNHACPFIAAVIAFVEDALTVRRVASG